MPLNRVSIPNEEIYAQIKTLIDEGHNVTIAVVGTSMQPFFESYRDEIMLTKCSAPKVNDVVLARTDHNLYAAHRVTAICGQRFTMRGDGNVYGTETAAFSDIIGVVNHYRRCGAKEFRKLDSLRWRWHTLTWPRNTTLRRLALAFHHHIYLKLLWLAKKPEWIELERKRRKK